MSPAAALKLVQRMRRRLEAMRIVRGAARGALIGAGVSVSLLFTDRLGVLTAPALLIWAPFVSGLLLGAGVALSRRPIDGAGAALLLDAHHGTEERFVTLWADADHERATEWSEEIGDADVAPTLPLPREAGLVPVAAFLIFVGGLLPAIGETPERASDPVAVATASNETADAESASGDPEAVAKRLEEPAPLDPNEVRKAERAIEAAFARPEDRTRAKEALKGAADGDRAEAKRLAKAIVAGAGALSDERAVSERNTNAAQEGGARSGSPYRDEIEFLRAYQIERARRLESER